MTTLSVKRKADRLKMASMVSATATAIGATCEIEEMPNNDVFAVVEMGHGLFGTIEFDGKTAIPNIHMISWYVKFTHETRLHMTNFPADVNNVHQRKATFVTNDFNKVIDHINEVGELVKSGDAFEKV